MVSVQPPFRAVVPISSRRGRVECARNAGFTVVELITTIILLAILSGFAMTRLVKPSSFEPSTLAHQLDLELKLAQSMATARQDAQWQFELRATAGAYQLQTRNSLVGLVRDTALDADSLTIAVTSGATSAVISTTDILQLTFAGDGTLAAASIGGSVVNPDNGFDINIAGDSNRALCLYPTGYLDARPCI